MSAADYDLALLGAIACDEVTWVPSPGSGASVIYHRWTRGLGQEVAAGHLAHAGLIARAPGRAAGEGGFVTITDKGRAVLADPPTPPTGPTCPDGSGTVCPFVAPCKRRCDLAGVPVLHS